MVRRLVPCLVLSALVVVSVPAVSSATSISGPNGKIAFTSGRPSTDVPAPNTGDKGARVYVADWPFGTPVQVTTLPAGAEVRHRQPNWSPDHTRIAYAAGSGTSYAIWIVDLRTGSQAEFVPAAEGQDRPSWSPDGTRIAYNAKGDLWVKGVAPGSEAVQLTNTAGITEERPVWSPDGNTLYYNRGVPPFNAGNKRDLYRKSPVTPAGAEVPVIATTEDEWQPSLSPDGNRLCYLQGPQSDAAKLRTVNVTGLGDAAFTGDGVTGALNCVWSPDGTTILYTRGAFGGGELATRDINGGSFTALSSMSVPEHFDGNSDWATNFPPTCAAKSGTVFVNNFTFVGLSCTDPDFGFGKEPPTPTPIDDSSLEIVTPPTHGVLGGLENGKVIYTPNKDFKGTDSFTYTGDDGTSSAKPAKVTIQVIDDPNKKNNGGSSGDKTPPSITAIKLAVKKWRLGKGLASISKSPVGTTISFTLSEAGSATVSFQRAVRRNGKLRYVNAGGLKSLPTKAGKNRVRFQGRLTKARSLAPGKYRVVIGAQDAAGNQSQPRTGPSFTIVTE